MTDEEKILCVEYVLKHGRRCYWSEQCHKDVKYVLIFPTVREMIPCAFYCKEHHISPIYYAKAAYDIEKEERKIKDVKNDRRRKV